MGDAFRMGGWGMYPTAIAGLVLVFCALRYAAAPDASRALLVRRLSMLTFLVGSLGTVMGTIKSFTAVEATITPAVVGFGESLNCFGLALVMLVLGCIAMAVGAARVKDPAELADPHTR